VSRLAKTGDEKKPATRKEEIFVLIGSECP
jgi:hypothetical protein